MLGIDQRFELARADRVELVDAPLHAVDRRGALVDESLASVTARPTSARTRVSIATQVCVRLCASMPMTTMARHFPMPTGCAATAVRHLVPAWLRVVSRSDTNHFSQAPSGRIYRS
jgi:hypothetical protein